jgi:hypothetical protein
MSEEWRPIPNFEGRYEVSDQGRVRSLTREWSQVSRHGTYYVYHKTGKILSPGPMPGGHLSVMLGRDGGSRCVHELVLLAFVGPPPPKTEARHRDGNEAHNYLSNLKWDFRGNNNRDKKWHKGQKTAKIYPWSAYFIKIALKHKTVKPVELRRIFNISKTTLYRIKNNILHSDIHVS